MATLKNGYTQKCEQKKLKINNRGLGGEGEGGWNKDVLGGKKIEKLTIGGEGGGDYSGLESNALAPNNV